MSGGRPRQKICCLADIEVLERNDSDEFLILACDGIWDVVSNEGIVVFVNYYLEVGGLTVEGLRNERGIQYHHLVKDVAPAAGHT